MADVNGVWTWSGLLPYGQAPISLGPTFETSACWCGETYFVIPMGLDAWSPAAATASAYGRSKLFPLPPSQTKLLRPILSAPVRPLPSAAAQEILDFLQPFPLTARRRARLSFGLSLARVAQQSMPRVMPPLRSTPLIRRLARSCFLHQMRGSGWCNRRMEIRILFR